MNFDGIEIEILPDGTIKTSTDKISQANHSNAEQFLALVAMMSGGQQKRVRKANAQATASNQQQAKQK